MTQVLKPGSAGRLACYCWLNTAALDDGLVFELDGSQLDKVRARSDPAGECIITPSTAEHAHHPIHAVPDGGKPEHGQTAN